MAAVIEPTWKTRLTEIALSAIIAEAVTTAKRRGVNKWDVYEWAKGRIDRLNPTADEYQRAIALLTEALKI